MKSIAEIRMKWLTVILFAVAAGLYTGLVLVIPFLKGTSFQDIGISYEWWTLFAVIIVINCRKNWDAMLKCFVFFLISQPIVYIVEAVFGTISFSQGLYYYKSIWLPMTFLTLPGGFIAFYCKKQNAFGSIILGLGNTIQTTLGAAYSIMAVSSFPYHILSALFCFASVLVMTFSAQKTKKYRMLSLLIAAVLTVAIIIFVKLTGRYIVPNVF